MNYEQLLLSALSKADEEPGDDIIDNVAGNSVNQGYQIVATEVDMQIKTIDFLYEDGYSFPDDFHSIITLEDEKGIRLSMNDFYIENQKLYITNRDYRVDDKPFYARYVFFPKLLDSPTDEPITNNKFDYMIILYGAYNILLYKKRYNMAQMIFTEFMRLKGGEMVDDV